jgi:hypothetical protein
MRNRTPAVDAVVARWHAVADRLAATDRGLSTALNYVLILGIVSILVTTLLFGFGGLVGNQQETTSREQLEVIGNRVAADLGQVDTLASHAPGNDQSVRSDLPTRVVGASYTISVAKVGTERYELTLTTGDPSSTVVVPFRSTTDISVPDTIYGGPLVFEYDSTPGAEQVVIRHA